MNTKRIIIVVCTIVLLVAVLAAVVVRNRRAAVEEGTVIVYTTDTGKRYHRADCRSLRYSKHATPLSEALASGLTPCKVCSPPVPEDYQELPDAGVRPRTFSPYTETEVKPRTVTPRSKDKQSEARPTPVGHGARPPSEGFTSESSRLDQLLQEYERRKKEYQKSDGGER